MIWHEIFDLFDNLLIENSKFPFLLDRGFEHISRIIFPTSGVNGEVRQLGYSDNLPTMLPRDLYDDYRQLRLPVWLKVAFASSLDERQ